MKNYLTLGAWRMSLRVTVIAVLAIALAVSLGRWQTRRADSNIALQERLLNAQSGIAQPMDVAAPDPATLIWHRVAISGTWMPADVVYLDNRPEGDRVGFYVIMPIKLASGAIVLVNRGWLPRDAHDRTLIPRYDTPDGTVDVTGVAMPDEARFLDLGSVTPKLGAVWENFSYDNFHAASGLSPVRIVVRQDNRTLDGLSREWPDRGAILQGEIDRHHGYVFQWYAMAAAIAGLLVYWGIKRGRGADV
jgi:surfeit locus 1 family protein